MLIFRFFIYLHFIPPDGNTAETQPNINFLYFNDSQIFNLYTWKSDGYFS